MNCHQCLMEISSEPRSGIDELSRRKGFCNWVCWERSASIPEQEINKVISIQRASLSQREMPVICYCAKCEKIHSVPMTPGEYKVIASAPHAITVRGELNMACFNCYPADLTKEYPA